MWIESFTRIPLNVFLKKEKNIKKLFELLNSFQSLSSMFNLDKFALCGEEK
jgi:hypothetical protein